MSLILKQALTGPAAWVGADLAHENCWLHRLSAQQVAEIDAALAEVRCRNLSFPQFSAADFPLPTLQVELARHAEELENGRGFVVLRGLPVERYSRDEINTIYYGLGLHLGQPVCQNPRGDLLGEVMNVGDLKDKNTRVYQTNLYLPYHSDPSDVVGLLCVRKAPVGGVSSLISVATVYNRILRDHPEYLGLLYRPMYFAHLCEDQPSLSPIFSYHQDKLSCRYLRQYLELGHEIRGLPLSRVEVEALDLFDSLIHDPELRLDMLMEPGDMQFANNYAVLHSRTEFQDHEDPAQRRLMLRLWLKMPNARQLAPEFPGRNGFPAPAEALAA